MRLALLNRADIRAGLAEYADDTMPIQRKVTHDCILLLNSSDRERAMDYVRTQVRTEAGVQPSVHLVSVIGTQVHLCHEWFESSLRPMLDAHRELTASSL